MAGILTGLERLGAPLASADGRRRLADSGAAAVEFALVLPVLLVILFSITSLGMALYNYEMLTGAVRAAARNFSIMRGTTLPVSASLTVLEATSPGLSKSILNTRMTAGIAPAGSTTYTTCTDTTCPTLLVAGSTGQITATYPCTIFVMGYNPAPSCTLTQTAANLIE